MPSPTIPSLCGVIFKPVDEVEVDVQLLQKRLHLRKISAAFLGVATLALDKAERRQGKGAAGIAASPETTPEELALAEWVEREDITVEPDSVLVYGTVSDLSRINYVHTETVYAEDLDGDKDGVVSLMTPPGLRLSEKMVHYTVSVSRYVEMKSTVNLSVVNLPAGERAILLPSRVTIIYRVPFPYQNTDETGFTAGIDYNDISRMNGMEMPVRLFSSPRGILSYRFQPPVVDFIEHE